MLAGIMIVDKLWDVIQNVQIPKEMTEAAKAACKIGSIGELKPKDIAQVVISGAVYLLLQVRQNHSACPATGLLIAPSLRLQALEKYAYQPLAETLTGAIMTAISDLCQALDGVAGLIPEVGGLAVGAHTIPISSAITLFMPFLLDLLVDEIFIQFQAPAAPPLQCMRSSSLHSIHPVVSPRPRRL